MEKNLEIPYALRLHLISVALQNASALFLRSKFAMDYWISMSDREFLQEFFYILSSHCIDSTSSWPAYTYPSSEI
jgi:hypothetical protein